MQNILKKKCHIALLTIELVGNNNFSWWSAIGHPHKALKTLLKYMYLAWVEIQIYFGYLSLNWLVLKNRLVRRMRPSAKLRSAPGEKDKQSQMLLVSA